MPDLSDFLPTAPAQEASPQIEGQGMESIADLIVEALGADDGYAEAPQQGNARELEGIAETLLEHSGFKDMSAGQRSPYAYIVEQAQKRGIHDSDGLKRWLREMMSIVSRGQGRSSAQMLADYLRNMEMERARQGR